jgi:hypothetical protein
MMSRKCPNCSSVLGIGSTISLLLGFKRRCGHCGTKLRNSSIGMFALSVLAVFATIASLGFVNLLGVYGFVFVGVVPMVLFIFGGYFVPLEPMD